MTREVGAPSGFMVRGRKLGMECISGLEERGEMLPRAQSDKSPQLFSNHRKELRKVSP